MVKPVKSSALSRLCLTEALTRGIGAAPTLGQTQRVSAPGRGGLVVGEAWWRPGGGRGAAGPLRDFPELVRQRTLALGDRPL